MILASVTSEVLGCLIVDVIGSMRQVVDSQIGSLLFSGFVLFGTALWSKMSVSAYIPSAKPLSFPTGR